VLIVALHCFEAFKAGDVPNIHYGNRCDSGWWLVAFGEFRFDAGFKDLFGQTE
jgi:hypothetical protein